MLGAVFFILLIASANVANLLLDRAAHRSKEVAVRTALGASRGAIIRQFLVGSALLSAGGAVVGVGIGYAGVVGFNPTLGAAMQAPFFVDIRLHIQVLLFAMGVAGLTTLVAGVLPAIRSSSTDVNTVLKDETRGASSLRLGKISKAIVIFEIALSSVVLVAAGLMMKSVRKTTTMDPGYRTTDVYTARIGFPATYSDTLAKWRFFDDVVARTAMLPGVRSVSISSGLPAARQGLARTLSHSRDSNTSKTRTIRRRRVVPSHLGSSRRSAFRSSRGGHSPKLIGKAPCRLAVVNR